MTKRRIKVDVPLRQPEKLIELAEAIFKRNNTEHLLDEEFDCNRLHRVAIEARNKREKVKSAQNNSKALLNESNTLVGIASGQNKSTTGTIYYYILSIRDHLKDLYKGKEEKLIDWGYDVEVFQIRNLRKVKIHIPINNAEMLIDLGEKICIHSSTEPGVLKSFNLKELLTTVEKARKKRREAKKAEEESTKLLEEANILVGLGYGQTKETEGTIFNQVNLILKTLLIKFKSSEERLNDWGFKTTVVHSKFPIKGNAITTKKIIAITNQQPLITIHIIFKGSNGKKVYVSWGDGSADKINLIGHTTPNSIYHDYTEEGEYEIQISGDISRLSFFKINSNQIISIDIPKNLKNLIHVSLKNNFISSNKIINDFLANLDSAGVFNGELDVSGGSNASPSSYGNIFKTNLINRGWEIITN